MAAAGEENRTPAELGASCSFCASGPRLAVGGAGRPHPSSQGAQNSLYTLSPKNTLSPELAPLFRSLLEQTIRPLTHSHSSVYQ